MRRQPVYRRSPDANAFYPEHAPSPEAPYIHHKSTSSLPNGSKASTVMSQRVKVEDVSRMERRKQHCLNAAKERERIEGGWKLRRQELEQNRKKDKYDAWLRMQKDKDEREARWVQKTANHAFAVDLWEEDQQIYGRCQAHNIKDKERQRQTAKAMMNNSQSKIKAKIDEIDVLGGLRTEKKKLHLDQKELKARLDLDKVEKRLFNVKLKEDAKHEAHQQMLASKGHLDRSHSDFFTEHRLSPQQRLQRASSQPMFGRGPSSPTLGGHKAMFQRVLTRLEDGDEIPTALLEHAFLEIDVDGLGSLQLIDLDDALAQCGSSLSQTTMDVIAAELIKRAEQDEINTDMGWTEFVEFFKFIEDTCRSGKKAAGDQQDLAESSDTAGLAESSPALGESLAKPEDVVGEY